MEITLQKTSADYKKFITYYCFKHKLSQKLFIIVLIAAVCNGSDRPFTLTSYLINFIGAAFAYTFIFFLITYIKSTLRLTKTLKSHKHLLEEITIITTEIGIEIQYEAHKESWQWKDIKQVEDLPDYIYITWYSNLSSLILPKKYFSSANEAHLFYVSIENKLLHSNGPIQKQDGRHLYNWGFLGLIPNVGVVAGFVLLFKGLFTYKDKKLIVIGIADILFTVVFWYVFTNFVIISSPFDEPKSKMAQSELNSIVKNIEFFHQQKGSYPDSLGQLRTEEEFLFIYDPFLETENENYFHYSKIRDKYTLSSVGIDRLPNTLDDIYPTVTQGDTINFGFVKQ
ncbi:MAG: hypothetical protein K0R51_746 [Cytophagaceae bacterium]|jgi:hypothetical protein|nr:hypothetical protein [Cytophagaceae bacterium]